MHTASPIMIKTATKNIIPNNNLNVSPICPKRATIFLSASGSQTADAKLYVIVRIASLIIGIAHIPITTIIPTIPNEFFNKVVAPITMSTESPKAFPTTGISVELAAFNPFNESPSILLVSELSKEIMLINIATTIPNKYVIPDLKNLEIFSILISSDRLAIIPITVAISVSGIIIIVIAFPIKIIINIIKGSIKPYCSYTSVLHSLMLIIKELNNL